MIPTVDQVYVLWQRYNLPENKRIHSQYVADVARWLANAMEKALHIALDKELIYVAGLLHDIDKNIPHAKDDKHPDAGVRLLRKLHMDKVAALVRTHPLHTILDNTRAPKTWEEKIVYLADKMTKYDVISVDERFALWKAEDMSPEARVVLEKSYPQVKQLEQEVCTILRTTPEKLTSDCKHDILHQERKHI